MNRIVIVLIILCACCNTWAQDVIVKKNGEEILAKVEDVSSTVIKYKKTSNLSGPLYTIQKSEVFMIKYENGSRDVFGSNNPTDTKRTDDTKATTVAPNTGNQSSLQGRVDLLEVSSGFLSGTKVRDRSGKSLSKNEVRGIMANTPDALALYNTGISRKGAGNFFGVLCGACTVGGLSALIFGGINEDKDMLSVGLGLAGGALVLAIPAGILYERGVRKIDSAVDVYNSAAIQRQRQSNVSLHFGATRSGGIGLTLNF
jgi:hypothetical protein